MEQEYLLCAKFILDMNKDGYYVDKEVLDAAIAIIDDYVSENDCDMDYNVDIDEYEN